MIKNYFKTAFRNLWKTKAFSAINILGLTTGLTCCLLIGVYIAHELSYDRFQQKGDRIARVIMEYSFGGTVNKGNYTSTKVFPAFKKNFPEVETGVRMSQRSQPVRYNDKLFNEKNCVYADSTFFDLFSFSLLKGDPREALSGPGKVLLTQSTARKYFGAEDPVGKIIKMGSGEQPYEITGILQDCPTNSQVKFDFLASFSSLGETQEETYWDANYTTYLLLRNEKDLAALQEKIPAFMKKEMNGSQAYILFHLEPFKRVHLYSEYDGFEPGTSITYIYILAAVALLILAIACFTYINLGTAASLERAKEVGVRKVMGAFRSQVFWQFIGESLLLSLIALAISMGLTVLLMPYFNQLTGKTIAAAALFSPQAIGVCLLVVIVISLLAGSYPALVLSGFQAIKVLKGAFKNTASGLWLRKSLIVFQLVISVFLVVSTFVIQRQLHFIQNKQLGYDRDHVLVLPMDQEIMALLPAFKTACKENPGVISLSRAVSSPVYIKGGYNMRRPEMPPGLQLSVRGTPVDEDYIKTTGLQLIAGSDLTEQDMKDEAVPDRSKKLYHFILNESSARALGWTPAAAIGKSMFLDASRPGVVRGVVKDFNFESMRNPIAPLILFPEERGNMLLVKLSGQRLPQSISFLEKTWKSMITQRPFEYHFLDEYYDRMYSAELRLGKVLNIFSVIAILLACLGLSGLSSYTAQQRVKEIGIRKILGASASNIATILSKDFVTLTVVALLIAFPIAGWATNRWLQDFVYRTTVHWWIYILAGLAVVVITLCTVGYHALRAGLANPGKSLRTE